MLSRSQLVKNLIRKTLKGGEKPAREIVKSCAEDGIKTPTTFYWLKKLVDAKEVRKVESGYKLIKVEKASKKEIDFLLEKLGRNKDVKRAAKQDLRTLCGEKRVGHHKGLWDFIRDGLKGRCGKGERELAIEFAFHIIRNPSFDTDNIARDKLRGLWAEFESAVLDKSLKNRYDAVIILSKILIKEEITEVFPDLLKKVIPEQPSPLKLLCTPMWEILLDIDFESRKLELRKWVYSLLGSGEQRVRDRAFVLLDELRLKERGAERGNQFGF